MSRWRHKLQLPEFFQGIKNFILKGYLKTVIPNFTRFPLLFTRLYLAYTSIYQHTTDLNRSSYNLPTPISISILWTRSYFTCVSNSKMRKIRSSFMRSILASLQVHTNAIISPTWSLSVIIYTFAIYIAHLYLINDSFVVIWNFQIWDKSFTSVTRFLSVD